MQNPFTDSNEPNQSAAKPTPVSVGDLFSKTPGTINSAPPAPVAPVFKASGRVSPFAIPLFLVYAPLVALGVGWLYWWIYQFGNMIAFSQMFFGFALGAMLWPAIKWGKCRNTKVAGLVGFLTALLAYSVFLGLSARAEREAYVQDYTTHFAKKAGVTEAKMRPHIERLLSPSRYFRIWMEDRAYAGVTLVDSDKAGNSSSGMRFQGKGFWALTAGEIGLVAIFAILAACGAAGGRFNEEKNQWWNKKTFYNVHPSHVRALVESAQAGNWAMVGRIGQQSKSEGQVGASVALYTCENETVLSVFPPNKANSPFWEGPIPPEGVAALPRLVGGPKNRVK